MLPLTPPSRRCRAPPPGDGRQGMDGLAAGGRQVLGEPPLEGAGAVLRPRSGPSLPRLLDDGQGEWLRRKRLSQGRCAWWPTSAAARVPLSARALIMGLGNGNPDRAPMAQAWRRVASGEARRRASVHGHPAAACTNPSRRCSCSAPRESTAWPPA
jgi:IS66 Orf2 like protein